jgi:polar amino acid transport system permease protein
MVKKFQVFLDAIQKEYFRELLLTGLRNTLLIAVLGLLIGILIGTIIAIVKVAPKYKWYMRVLNVICNIYVEFFRGTPMTVQLLLAYYVIVPLLKISGVDALHVGIIVFGLNSAAYVSEIMRGGINSVDPGQLLAGRALGLSYPTTMIKIVIPQAIKNILPTLGNEFITLIKETSVLSFITVSDLYFAFYSIQLSTNDTIVTFLIMAVIYLVIVLGITWLIRLLERSLNKSDRRN